MVLRGKKREDADYFYYPQTGDGYARIDKTDLGGLPSGEGFLYRDSNGVVHMVEPANQNVTSITPENILTGTPTNIVITGANFGIGTEIDFGNGADVTSFEILSTSQIAATVEYSASGAKTITASIKGDKAGTTATLQVWSTRLVPDDNTAWINTGGGTFGVGTVRKTTANTGVFDCVGQFGTVADGADFMLRWRALQHSATLSVSGGAMITDGTTTPIPFANYPSLASVSGTFRYGILHLTSNVYRDNQDNATGSSFSPWAANDVFDIRRLSNVSTGRRNGTVFTTYATPHTGDLQVLFCALATPNTSLDLIGNIELFTR